MGTAAQRETLAQNQQSDALESQTAQTDSGPDRGDSQDASFDASVSDDERRRMIAEAAYFIALRRDFDGGLELEDWLAAEAEVNAKLRSRARGHYGRCPLSVVSSRSLSSVRA